MNKMIGAIAGIVIIVAVFLVIRKMDKDEALEAERARQEREARQHVDLSALPEAPPPEKKVEEVKFKKKPIVVEMMLKTKKGKAFTGKYRLISPNGEIVGQDEAPPPGEPAVFIVAPGKYQLEVPGTKFKKELTLIGNDEGKMAIDVVIAAR